MKQSKESLSEKPKQDDNLQKDDLIALLSNTPKILKGFVSIGTICGMIVAMTFYLTYMRENEIYSFEIFSISNIWLWIVAIIYCAMLFGPLSFQIVTLPYNSQTRAKHIWLFCLYVAVILLEVVIISLILYVGFTERTINANWIIFIISGIVLSCFVIVGIIKYFEIRQKTFLYGVFIVVIAFYIFSAFVWQEVYSTAFKRFLTSQGLAAKEVEIYLEDSKEYIVGEMLFSDNKYAFVEFRNHLKSCDKSDTTSYDIKTLKRKIPIEHITIIKPHENKDPKDKQI